MAYIVDARNAGNVISLSKSLTLPSSSAAVNTNSPPPLGSLRFNAVTNQLEIFREDTNGVYGWYSFDASMSADTSTLYPKSGGPLNGNLVLQSSARMIVPLGTSSQPTLTFSQAQTNGFYATSDNRLHLSILGTETVEFSSGKINSKVAIQSSNINFNDVSTDNLSFQNLSTILAGDLNVFRKGPFAQSEVLYRYVVASKVIVNDNWVGSFATLGTALGTSTLFKITITRSGLTNTVGTINFTSDGLTGTFSSVDGFSLIEGDILQILAPDTTTTGANLCVSLSVGIPSQQDEVTTILINIDIGLSFSLLSSNTEDFQSHDYKIVIQKYSQQFIASTMNGYLYSGNNFLACSVPLSEFPMDQNQYFFNLYRIETNQSNTLLMSGFIVPQ